MINFDIDPEKYKKVFTELLDPKQWQVKDNDGYRDVTPAEMEHIITALSNGDYNFNYNQNEINT